MQLVSHNCGIELPPFVLAECVTVLNDGSSELESIVVSGKSFELVSIDAPLTHELTLAENESETCLIHAHDLTSDRVLRVIDWPLRERGADFLRNVEADPSSNALGRMPVVRVTG